MKTCLILIALILLTSCNPGKRLTRMHEKYTVKREILELEEKRKYNPEPDTVANEPLPSVIKPKKKTPEQYMAHEKRDAILVGTVTTILILIMISDVE